MCGEREKKDGGVFFKILYREKIACVSDSKNSN